MRAHCTSASGVLQGLTGCPALPCRGSSLIENASIQIEAKMSMAEERLIYQHVQAAKNKGSFPFRLGFGFSHTITITYGPR